MSKSLSEIIRKIAQEPVVEGEKETQAEALARKMWQMAQGYDEKVGDGDKIRKHAPDKKMIVEVVNRLEGRVATMDMKDGKKITIANRVKEQSRERMNALAKGTGSSSRRNSKTETQGTVS